MKVGVIGAGTWGTALAQVLCDNNHDVFLLSTKEHQVNEINSLHKNSKYFGNEIFINEKIVATLSYETCAQDSDYIVLAVPTIAIRDVIHNLLPYIKKPTVFINAAKGFDVLTNKRLSEVIKELIPHDLLRGFASIIGPGHAEEVIIRKLTMITSTSLDIDIAKEVQLLFSNNYLRVYTNTDEIGAELGVAIKNVIAIASGILEGLDYGDNTRAALVTRGLHEIVRFGHFFGGKMETFMGLAGIGDLMVTCNSRHSRNYRAGVIIGKDDSSELFLKYNEETTEGVRTTRVVYELAKKHNIYMPIVTGMYKILYENAKPSDMIKDIINLPLKSEKE